MGKKGRKGGIVVSANAISGEQHNAEALRRKQEAEFREKLAMSQQEDRPVVEKPIEKEVPVAG